MTVLWSPDGPIPAIQGSPTSPRIDILGEALIYGSSSFSCQILCIYTPELHRFLQPALYYVSGPRIKVHGFPPQCWCDIVWKRRGIHQIKPKIKCLYASQLLSNYIDQKEAVWQNNKSRKVYRNDFFVYLKISISKVPKLNINRTCKTILIICCTTY